MCYFEKWQTWNRKRSEAKKIGHEIGKKKLNEDPSHDNERRKCEKMRRLASSSSTSPTAAARLESAALRRSGREGATATAAATSIECSCAARLTAAKQAATIAVADIIIIAGRIVIVEAGGRHGVTRYPQSMTDETIGDGYIDSALSWLRRCHSSPGCTSAKPSGSRREQTGTGRAGCTGAKSGTAAAEATTEAARSGRRRAKRARTSKS
jgi:hypothetical protein